ncbi:MAG: hypothetical protein COV30_01475 [Candidatus Yanofskybacteria bacterium CG10_big_fil_rev_8_21_14_0_10_37_15]|uniref:Nudix hydrolase domain-containing protein n=1 Tax=Candidatus Yanofskybacteria bacterium CG10_big_fil_rev_8_21_14_0_10_37_15 TaxID=1975097 RepID=A0A2H0R5R6_9BACT|nr:MAG: hypothetical protein COV30_01475 [Candidatus Yanofskybacteria bacterium CG10_big_fil_rev_8_21_14_0_10_37_15]
MEKELKIEKFNFQCVLHGSFRKHFGEIKRIYQLFTENGIGVLAPTMSEIKTIEGGFAMLESDQEKDPRMIELLYLHNLKRLGENGFSYFVNPEGYIGKSASYELGIAHVSNVRCFFQEKPTDHPAYVHKNSVWKPERFLEFILNNERLPEPQIKKNDETIYKLWEGLIMPGSVVSVGGIIEYESNKPNREKEVLLVKTHKWGNQYSVVGGRVRRNERLEDALVREIKEETGLESLAGEHICTFDQIKNSGYYLSGIQHIFVDKVVRVSSKNVCLNEEAQDYVWMPPQNALRDLSIEPNARHTLELYMRMFAKNKKAR